jgi:hypothetical protein
VVARVALKVPVAVIPPVMVAVPAAEYPVAVVVRVAVTLRLALEVAAWATAQANNAVKTRNISSSVTERPGGYSSDSPPLAAPQKV